MSHDLARDLWPNATPDQLVILSKALEKAFNRLASPCPAQIDTNVRTKQDKGSSLSVAFKQQSDSVE